MRRSPSQHLHPPQLLRSCNEVRRAPRSLRPCNRTVTEAATIQMALPRNAQAASLRSFASNSTYDSRDASSTATNANSNPRFFDPNDRLRVMRWPTRSKRPSRFVSMCSKSPGSSRSYRIVGPFGSRLCSRLRPALRQIRATLERLIFATRRSAASPAVPAAAGSLDLGSTP